MIDVSKLSVRQKKRLRRQALEQIAREVAERLLNSYREYDNITIEGLFRALSSNDLEVIGDLTLHPHDERDDPATRERVLQRMDHYRAIIQAEDPDQAIADELKRCSEDIHHWIDHWTWAVDPRPDGLKRIPFVMWARQREVIDFILGNYAIKQPCGVKKSRDAGLTVICALIGIWAWLFKPGIVVTYGSLKQDRVHKLDDPDSIFEKMKVVLESLPVWMLPKRFSLDRNFKELLIKNPQTGAVLKGEVGDNMGRGGRAAMFFADEFAELPRQETVKSSISGTTDFCCYFSTSAGRSTHFYKMESDNEIPFFHFPWYWDPRKLDNPEDVGNPDAPSRWRDKMMRSPGPVIFAQQFACDDVLADPYIVILPEWITAAIRLGEIAEGSGDIIAGFDPSDGGEDDAALVYRQGCKVWVRERKSGLKVKALAPIINRIVVEDGVAELFFDKSGIGYDFEAELKKRHSGSYKWMGILAQDKPSFRALDDSPEPASARFANRTTELWWALRSRFFKTWEHVNGHDQYPLDELIALEPGEDTNELANQLTTRRYEIVGQGKLKLEDKKKMLKSPDLADGLTLTEDISINVQARQHEIEKHNFAKSKFSKVKF
jgi:hypothetical protein